MATSIYLGNPPENIKKWIIDNYVEPEVDMLKVPLTFTAEEPGAKLSLQSNGDPDNPTTITLETSSTGEEGSWTPYEVGTEITLANVGDKVMFRNSSDEIQVINISDVEYNQFKIDSGKIAASGNIMFLMDKTGELRDLSGKEYCYYWMFYDCTTLTRAPELPATTLASGCYREMFYNCSSLTHAPELPATTLADSCYVNMFGSCTSLTKSPELPATTLAWDCYSRMFDDCTNIPEPKYKIPNLTFDEVANVIVTNASQDVDIFSRDSTNEVQCSDKILVATFDWDNMEWTLTEK